MPLWKEVCKFELFTCYLDTYRPPCHLSAVFSGLSGPEFYLKDKAQKERTAKRSFLTEPGKNEAAPLAEGLTSVHEAWVHPQHCGSWVRCLWKTQKQKEVGSAVQGHLQLPREFPGQPGIHEATEGGA